MKSFFSKRYFLTTVVSSLLSIFVVAVVAYGATMTISNVGLGSGTSTPGAALGVQGAAIIDDFVWANAFVATSTSMASGFGTTSPGAEFAVAGGALFEGRVIASSLESTSTVASSFGGALGISTSSPWALNSISGVVGTTDEETPRFVISDVGTSTPTMIVKATSSVGFYTNNPRTKFNVHDEFGTSTIYISTGLNYGDQNHGGTIILKDAKGDTCTVISSDTGVLKTDAITCPGQE
ncbi:MAG: hypothetical protein Q8Q95_01670 [bacterium]|nr:hypothetical protein [bacterium]